MNTCKIIGLFLSREKNHQKQSSIDKRALQITNFVLDEENKHLKPLLDSAIRAIKKSSPFEGIQKYSYNKWKKNTINFRPFENTQ